MSAAIDPKALELGLKIKQRLGCWGIGLARLLKL
jgi:hypothetical protein